MDAKPEELAPMGRSYTIPKQTGRLAAPVRTCC
jgi:hypothetical protein